MKEYIEREVAIELGKKQSCAGIIDGGDFCNISANMLRNIPAADVVEVVRCAKCKHWLPGTVLKNNAFKLPYCQVRKAPMYWDDYCSYGERKMDGGVNDAAD